MLQVIIKGDLVYQIFI